MSFYKTIIPFVMFDIIESVNFANEFFAKVFHPKGQGSDDLMIED